MPSLVLLKEENQDEKNWKMQENDFAAASFGSDDI